MLLESGNTPKRQNSLLGFWMQSGECEPVQAHIAFRDFRIASVWSAKEGRTTSVCALCEQSVRACISHLSQPSLGVTYVLRTPGVRHAFPICLHHYIKTPLSRASNTVWHLSRLLSTHNPDLRAPSYQACACACLHLPTPRLNHLTRSC